MSDKTSKLPSAKAPIYKGDTLWQDPFPDDLGSVLLSDKIAYCAENYGLVVPFNRDRLRSAQYTLRVGEEGYRSGSKFKIDKDNPLVIPPNGLVYIKIDEYFNIPYYMIARYSLRVDQVYRGLILDNGLQIDPGYHGHINVPVYNFTNEPKTLEYHERILSVEFVKTTAFVPDPAISAEEEREWVNSGVVNKDGYPLKVFTENPDKLYSQKSISGLFRHKEKNESSVKYLAESVDKFKKRQLWSGIGLSAIIIALFGYIYQTHDSFAQARIEAEKAVTAVKLQQMEVKEKYEKASLVQTELEKKRDKLVKLIGEFESRLYDAETGLKQSYETIIADTNRLEDRLGNMEKLREKQIKELQERVLELKAELQKKKEGQLK